ncbi:hypothetical protein K438DRAFT_1749648 [Mycena galopus ATCC 62051]|nr:hypothetical protein K438DRAFT_1749648 [Mycena galopus ATCC 62051]
MAKGKKGNKAASDPADDAQPKKRGQESAFKGAQLAYMTENVEAYIEAGKHKGREAKTDSLGSFWATFFDEYWKRFPWDLPLDKDPDPNAPPLLPPETAEEAYAALGLNLSPEEAARKSKIQSETKSKVKRWFSRQRPKAMGIQGNPFFEYLTRLRREESDGPPRRPNDAQFYMSHENFKDAVTARFLEEEGDQEPKAKQLALRCKIAKEMLDGEDQDVKDRIARECDEAHKEDLATYKESEDGLPSPDADVQRHCRDNFLAIVQPLLVGLKEYTGLTLNIIGAHINEETGNFETMSANAGIVDGKDWPRWDPDGYGANLKMYLKFVHAGYLESQSLIDMPGPSSSAPRPAVAATSTPLSGKRGGPAGGDTCRAAPSFVGLISMDGDVEMRPATDQTEGSGLAPLVEDKDDERLTSGVILGGGPTAAAAAPAPPAPPTPAVAAPAAPAAPPAAPAPPTPAAAAAATLAAASAPPAPTKPYWGIPQMTEEWRQEILAKSGDERSTYIARVLRMTPHFQERKRRTKNCHEVSECAGLWVKNARKGVPDIGTVESMEAEWWAWWTGINPTWQMGDDGELLQTGDGTWEALSYPGQNGFLNILVCLKWWYSSMGTPSAEWEKAVGDVVWVLGKMVGRSAPNASAAPTPAAPVTDNAGPTRASVPPAASSAGVHTDPAPAAANPAPESPTTAPEAIGAGAEGEGPKPPDPAPTARPPPCPLMRARREKIVEAGGRV